LREVQSKSFGIIEPLSAHQRPELPFNGTRRWAVWISAVLLAVLAGCATSQPKPAPGIAVLLSDRSPAMVGVQREIVKRHPQRIETYVLGDNESLHRDVQKKIQSSGQPVVVAIGLPAARVARSLTGKKVIFCQVFTYEDEDLVTSWMKGVSTIAPVREQFRTWMILSPKLKTVGVITGKGMRGLMEEARAAAKESRIKLIHVEVRSDKEYLYTYKQLTQQIQGLWMVPDNRVLSLNVIRDIMAHSVKEGKDVAVFTQELLSLGGLISAETSGADIAEQVLTRIRESEQSTGVTGAPIVPLTKAVVKINAVMAQRLNLRIAKSLQGMAYAP
jgi:ABC-type uncharacterized transport system substrate-binding protein